MSNGWIQDFVLDLVEFTRRSDGSKGMIPKITVYEWSYVPGGKRAEGGNANVV